MQDLTGRRIGIVGVVAGQTIAAEAPSSLCFERVLFLGLLWAVEELD